MAIGRLTPCLDTLLPCRMGLRVKPSLDLEIMIEEIRRSTAVASTCDICGKGPSFGNNVSHSQVKTRRRWNPNIQRVRTLVGGSTKRQNVCTSCLKAGKVTR
jgi:large subunit ribosomal protein L28